MGPSLNIINSRFTEHLHWEDLTGQLVAYGLSANWDVVPLGQNLQILACEKWSRSIFTSLKGKKCIRGAPRTKDLRKSNYRQGVSLHQACREGKLELVKYILFQGMENINSQERYSRTPVMIAARRGWENVFDFLVSQGCILSGVDSNNDNLLHIACFGGNVDIVRKIVESETFDIESKGWNQWTPLIGAVYHNHREVFEYLVSKNCNTLVVDKSNYNILHIASLKGLINLVKLILSQKLVDIESRGQTGRTAVMLAAENGKKDTFDLLVSIGGNLFTRDGDNNTILHVACSRGHVDMVKYIISKDVVDIDETGHYGRTPIMLAAEKGHIDIFDLLINSTCKVDVVDADNNNILHIACIRGRIDMVKYIIFKDILNVEIRGQQNKTSLMLAAEHGHEIIVKYLVDIGCSLMLKDNHGHNILHIACIGGYIDMVKYLISLNALKGMENAKGKQGRTPVQVAQLMGHTEIVDLLTERSNHLG